MELVLNVADLATGQETAFASSADSMLSKLDKQDIKKSTAKLYQDKVGWSFNIPDSQRSVG